MKYTIDEIVINGLCIKAETKEQYNKVVPYLRGSRNPITKELESPVYFVSLNSITRGNIGLGIQSSSKDIFTGRELTIIPFEEINFY